MKKIGVLVLFLWQLTSFGQATEQANWQQDVSYNIQVSLDDENHVLNGHIEIGYTNNSPQTLNEVWIHLWPNAYKNNTTAFAKQQLQNNSTSFYFAKPRARGYIDSLDFTVEENTLQMSYHPEHIDIAKLTLNSPLKPGESIVLSSPFRVKIPGSFSRMGHVKNSYQITQWFPKPAVFDINGWNTMPYLDQGEFYSEFGSFNVSITVPQNYVIAATGVLQDSSEKEWLKERITYYKGRGKREEEETASSALLKTLHFKQDKIHDFAWFADKEFYVFESKQVLPDSSATIQTYLYSASEYDKAAIQYVNQGVKFYSEHVGNYPYSSASAVIGPLEAGGGMEYPMITVLASTDRTTVVHEVGHNWFYGIVGSNERSFPWMDESINTYYENRHSKSLEKDNDYEQNYNNKLSASGLFMDGLGLVYANSLTRNTDQAVNLPSEDFTSSNYGGIVYGKGAYIFSVLQQYLGDSMFDAAMQNYYEEWKFKHPLPGDFSKSIQQFTGQDLDWFFTDLLTTTKSYDYKISKIRYKKVKSEDLQKNPNNFQVLVTNKGKVSAPFQIMTIDENGEKLKSRWDSGFMGKQWVTLPGMERYQTLNNENLKKKEAKRVVKRMNKVEQVALNLDNPLNELNIHNNRIKTQGILKKTERLALGGANHLDRRTTPGLVPLVNYNHYDNWMIGGALNNLAHWERRFHYYAAGFYSGNLEPIKYELFARQIFALNLKSANRLDVYGKAASFGYEPGLGGLRSSYQKLKGGISLYLKNPKRPNTREFRKLDISYNKLQDVIDKASSDAASITPASYATIVKAVYEFKSNKKLNPLEYQLTVEQITTPTTFTFNQSSSSQKVFGEITKVFHFSKMNNYLKTRLFTGFIFGNNTPSIYNYSTGGNNGLTDYSYDRNLLARSERFNNIPNGTLAARVLVPHFSGMRIPVWMPSRGSVQAINLEYNLKKKLPFNLYLDMSYTNNSLFNDNFNYVAGINFTLIKNYLELSLPLVYSKDFANQMDFTGIKESKHLSNNYNPFKNWHRLIVFKLNLDFSQDDLINLSGL